MASGDTLIALNPLAYEPPATNYATIDTRNSHPVLDFNAATEQAALFTGVLPRNYSGAGVTITIRWGATSATTGSCVWGVAFERITGGLDINSDDFAAEKTAFNTTNSTPGVETITSITFAHSELGGVIAADTFRFKVARKSTDENDTMAGDAELLAIEIMET
jgi:hypothetical protein